MPFPLFSQALEDCRAVEIPAELAGDARSRYVAKVVAAVRQQTELARRCDSVLRVTGEVSEAGNRLLIPHEPAAVADPAAIAGADPPLDINTLWWLTAATVRALAAAAAAKVVHGGIQLRALYLDELGRAKLGDFGIAAVFQETCGVDARHLVHCAGPSSADATGRSLSGVWSRRQEDERFEHGWIAPYFSHELLERQLPFNVKADQFALGTLLFALATGRHPYGAEWSDPFLGLYFQLEPYPLEEERPDWAEAFERHRGKLAQRADQPVLAWAELLRDLLASEPERRLAPADAVRRLVGEFVPPAWTEAAEALRAAEDLLDAGEADALLDRIKPWHEGDALPPLGRERLTAWAQRIESQKGFLRARKAREHRLAAGYGALDVVDLGTARAAAQALLDDPDAEEDLRARADELRRLCDEQQQFIESGADALAVAYLESAQEALGHADLDDARQVLQALLQDPALPPTRAAQARRLLGQVELTAQRRQRQAAELALAVEEENRTEYADAEQRLVTLLAAEDLASDVQRSAAALLEQVRERLRLRGEWLAALAGAQAAWELADLPRSEERLSQVPQDCHDREVEPRRRELSDACLRLRDALEKKRTAESLLNADRPAEAASMAQQAAGGDLPASLRASLTELAERCRQIEAKRRAAALTRARSACQQARTLYDQGDVDEARRTLEQDVLSIAELPDDLREPAAALLAGCTRAAAATAALLQARHDLGREDFDAATARLAEIDAHDLPSGLNEQLARLRADIAAAREKFISREQRRLAEALDRVQGDIEARRYGSAQAALREVERSAHLTDELRLRAAQLQAIVADRRSLRRRAGRLALAVGQSLGAGGRAFATRVRLLAAALGRGWHAAGRKTRAGAGRLAGGAWRLVGGVGRACRRLGRAVVAAVQRSFRAVGGAVRAGLRALGSGSRALPVSGRRLVQGAGRGARRAAQAVASGVTGPTRAAARGVGRHARPLATVMLGLVLLGAAGWYAVRHGPSLRQWLRDVRSPPAEVVTAEPAAEGIAPAPPPVQAIEPQPEPPESQVAARDDEPPPEPQVAARDDTPSLEPEAPPVAETPPAEPELVQAVEPSPAEPAPVVEVEEPPAEPPVPTFAEAAEAFTLAVLAAAPEGLARGQLMGEPGRPLEFAARWRGHDLLSYTGLTFDPQTGSFSQTPNEVAGWFAQQVDALIRAESLQGFRVKLDERYDSALVPASMQEIYIVGVEDGRPVLSLVIRLRLRDDTDVSAGFVGQGRLVEDVFEPDSAAHAAFQQYLRDLQRRQAEAALPTLARRLALPGGLELEFAERFDGGDTCPLRLACDGRALATLPATWNPSTLAYELDAAAAVAELAASEKLRECRQQAAIESLARDLKVAPGAIDAQRDADRLMAKLSVAGRTTRYAWQWDPQALDYAGPEELLPPSLDQQLAGWEGVPDIPAGEFLTILAQVATRKVEEYGAAEYGLAPELQDGVAEPAAALLALSRALKELTAPNPRADPFPIVFVEYYVGSTDVYALAWRADTDDRDQIVRVVDLAIWRVMPAAELRGLSDPATWRGRYSSDAAVGELLLGRALSAPNQPARASARGSFGVVVAPHERLWLTRWEQVRFSPRRVERLDARGAPDVGACATLRQVLQPHEVRRDGLTWRRAGLWCVPALAGAWRGAAGDPRLTLGELVPDKPPVSLHFRQYRPAGPVFAYVEDQTLTGDFGWRLYASEVRAGELGSTFWHRGWEMRSVDPQDWRPTPYTSFALLRLLSD